MRDRPAPRLLPVRGREGYDWRGLLSASRGEGHGWVGELLQAAPGPEVRLWVLVVAGEPRALGGVSPEPCRDLYPAARLLGIYVHPEERGQGYGQRLLARVLRHVRGRFPRLTARARDEEAARFLVHHGFVPFEHPCVSHFRPVGKG